MPVTCWCLRVHVYGVTSDSRALSSWEHSHLSQQLTEAREGLLGPGGGGQHWNLQVWNGHSSASPLMSHRGFSCCTFLGACPRLLWWAGGGDSPGICSSLALFPFRTPHAQAGNADGTWARLPPSRHQESGPTPGRACVPGPGTSG